MLVFEERGKPENPEKNLSEQDETQSTYDAGSGNRTRDTLVGGERSQHCAIPAPPSTSDGLTCLGLAVDALTYDRLAVG